MTRRRLGDEASPPKQVSPSSLVSPGAWSPSWSLQPPRGAILQAAWPLRTFDISRLSSVTSPRKQATGDPVPTDTRARTLTCSHVHLVIHTHTDTHVHSHNTHSYTCTTQPTRACLHTQHLLCHMNMHMHTLTLTLFLTHSLPAPPSPMSLLSRLHWEARTNVYQEPMW